MKAIRNLLGAGLLLIIPGALLAQGGTVRITVTDSATATPLPNADVVVRGAAGTIARRQLTDARGRVVLHDLPPGPYTFAVRGIGYRPDSAALAVASGVTKRLAIRLAPGAVVLEPLVRTASRTENQASLDVPVAMSVVGRQQLDQQLATTTIQYLADLPESQVLSGGLMSRRYTTRGPNFGTSANVRTMTDFRNTIIPGINYNADYLSTTTALDIARIELVRGQGTVMYGPNASRGVLNVITKSPLDEQGTAVQILGGSRDALQATAEQASLLGRRLGVRLSGEYFTGNDWLPPDYAADSAVGGTQLRRSRRLRASARVDWQANARTRATLFGGMAQASVFDPVTYGGFPALIDNGRIWRFQAMVTRGEAMANVFFTQNDVAKAQLTSLDFPFEDHTSNIAVQLQNGGRVGSRAVVRYGVDANHTAPASDSTLYGGYEGRADVTEVGGFVTATVHLSPRIETMLAARLDYTSIIGNLAFGPWAAIVFRPRPTHAIRLSVARSFTTGGAIDSWADFPVAALGLLPFQVRQVGDGTGRTFRRDCAGLCMRSPFNPLAAGGRAAYLPADATTQWLSVVALLRAQGKDISAVPAPNGSQVGSVLQTLNLSTGAFDPSAASDVVDVTGAERRWITQVELGYNGLVSHRLRLGADLYYRDINEIGSAVQVVTPNVFLDETSLAAYLANYLANAAEADTVARMAAAIPLGTVTPVQANNPTDLELGQFRLRGIHYWGGSLEAEFALTPDFTARAGYDWMSDNLVIGERGAQVVFNNPQNRLALGLVYDNARTGVSARVEARYLESYPATNGPTTATLPSYTVVNVTAGYRIPHTRLSASLAVYNALNDVHQELPAAARLGRYALAGLRASL